MTLGGTGYKAYLEEKRPRLRLLTTRYLLLDQHQQRLHLQCFPSEFTKTTTNSGLFAKVGYSFGEAKSLNDGTNSTYRRLQLALPAEHKRPQRPESSVTPNTVWGTVYWARLQKAFRYGKDREVGNFTARPVLQRPVRYPITPGFTSTRLLERPALDQRVHVEALQPTRKGKFVTS